MCFNQHHLDSINKTLAAQGKGFVANRSRIYSKAVVIGRPELPGSIIMSLVDDEVTGRSFWMAHLHQEADPKSLADGKIELTGEEFRYHYWADMLKGIEELTTTLA